MNNKEFDPTWRNTPMFLTHKSEFMIESILNAQLPQYNMRAFRKDSPYSTHDIDIRKFDYNELSSGAVLCRIDLERKPKAVFPKDSPPKEWVRGVSFLARKVSKESNCGRDVYLLFDQKPTYPKTIWITYDLIREYGTFENWGRGNEFYVIHEEHYRHLKFGYKSLINYCRSLENNPIVCSGIDVKKMGDDCEFHSAGSPDHLQNEERLITTAGG